MKRLVILSFTIALCSLGSLASAQQYQWDEYGVGFEVARDFVVQENTSSIFAATSSDGEISVSIVPWVDENLTLDNIEEVILDLAAELEFYEGGDIAGDYVEVDDFVGYFIITAPEDYRGYDYVVLVIFLDAESSTNLAISVGYYEGNFNEVAAIIDSFYAYD